MSGLLSKEDSAPRIKKRRPLRVEDSLEISEDEAQNFLKILSVLLLNDKVEAEKVESGDSVDGIGDVVVSTATRLSELLQCDMNSLSLPKALKKSLKLLKAVAKFLKSRYIGSLQRCLEQSLCPGEEDLQGRLQLVLQQ